jgi:pantothenate kinase-related protein Tda10
MDDLLTSIAGQLASPRPAGAPLLVAIDGAGGAGKSTLAACLAKRLRESGIEAEIVHMDDFYRPFTEHSRPLAAVLRPGQGLRHPCDDALLWFQQLGL